LFDLVNRLQTAMATGQGKKAIDPTLSELIEYTVHHFAAEERLMAAAQYPGLDQHKEQHRALTEKVLAFKSEYDAGRAALTIQVLQFLRDWLQTHILQSDRAYGPYVADERTDVPIGA
jgi:hemerythrin